LRMTWSFPKRGTARRHEMAHVHKGQLTSSPQWWRHLRDDKRTFWKAERKAQRFEAKARATEGSES
jgi:hypothetical protein